MLVGRGQGARALRITGPGAQSLQLRNSHGGTWSQETERTTAGWSKFAESEPAWPEQQHAAVVDLTIALRL